MRLEWTEILVACDEMTLTFCTTVADGQEEEDPLLRLTLQQLKSAMVEKKYGFDTHTRRKFELDQLLLKDMRDGVLTTALSKIVDVRSLLVQDYANAELTQVGVSHKYLHVLVPVDLVHTVKGVYQSQEMQIVTTEEDRLDEPVEVYSEDKSNDSDDDDDVADLDEHVEPAAAMGFNVIVSNDVYIGLLESNRRSDALTLMAHLPDLTATDSSVTFPLMNVTLCAAQEISDYSDTSSTAVVLERDPLLHVKNLSAGSITTKPVVTADAISIAGSLVEGLLLADFGKNLQNNLNSLLASPPPLKANTSAARLQDLPDVQLHIKKVSLRDVLYCGV